MNRKINSLKKFAKKTTDWVYGYQTSARNKCKFILQSDISFFLTVNGAKVIDQAKLEGLCQNNCSNNGACSGTGIYF